MQDAFRKAYWQPYMAAKSEKLVEDTNVVGLTKVKAMVESNNVIWDLVSTPTPRPGRVVPYVLGGAGFFRHFDRFGPLSFASNEGTFTAGGGARVWVTPRVYVGGEARVGWELHTRVGGTVGVRLGG